MNLGGDAWPSYYGALSDNKGSCYPDENIMALRKIGPTYIRQLCWGDKASFGNLPERDVDLLWDIGQVDPLISTAQPGTSNDPKPVRPVEEWKRLFIPEIDYWRKYGINPPVAPFVENLDHSNSPAFLADYVIALAEQTDLDIWVPAGALYNESTDAYYEGMKAAIQHPRVGGMCVHYYVRVDHPEDLKENQPYSPEWLAAKYGKPVWVAEFDTFEGKGDEAFKIKVAETLVRRWMVNPLVRGWAWYSLRTKDERWRHHWVTPGLLDTFQRLAVETRALRRFLASAPVMPPPNGDVDVRALTDVMHRLWTAKEYLVKVKDVDFHLSLADLHSCVEEYKKIVGVQ